ncbi:LPS translocon maturation chaperone LptM [Alteromonas mediterranea]|uniref:LPS translocon maturation chaperone LptM n=1 Tax=Alteromonas mediterranea TaxID=314275 RepID=UPI001E5D4DA9|nr:MULTISPECIES: lipoprotein [Alteromonas]
MLKKSVVFLLTLTALGGCGYKGALYIPEAPAQNTPAEPAPSEDADSSSDINNTFPAPTSGEQN